jgi:methionine biosynthesis protein MetW
MEIEAGDVAACVAKGLSVIQGDADRDLAFYPDLSFDYAILSETLQTMMRPDLVLEELLRIGKHAFVSFPNFAHWRVRMSLLFGGQMPVTRLLPVAWYETPNIHHLTVADFRALMAERGIRVEQAWFLSGDKQISASAANWRAEHAIYLLAR